MKRYIYIIIGIILAALIAIGVLFLFKGDSALSGILPASITNLLPSVGTQGSNSSSTTTNGFGSPSASSGTTNSTGQGAGAQNFNIAVVGPVLDYIVGAQNNITAIQPSGAIFTVTGAQSSTISSSSIDDIISAKFSSDGTMLLVNYGDPNNPQSSIFNITKNTWTTLPQGLHSPQWSPSGYQIAYLNDPGTGISSLGVMNAANLKSGTATLFTLNATDLSLQWISQNQFLLSDKPSAQTTGSSWLYNSQAKTLTPVAYEALGFESIWGGASSTTLGLAFYEEPNDQKMEFQLIDGSGNDLHDLNFLTLPSKCLFNNETSTAASGANSSDATTTASSSVPTPENQTSTTVSVPFLYCGVPTNQNQLSSAQLPDDYNDGSLFTSDTIIKLNTNTGDISTLWSDPTQNIDATDLKIYNGTLYFINRYDQKLYSLALPQ